MKKANPDGAADDGKGLKIDGYRRQSRPGRPLVPGGAEQNSRWKHFGTPDANSQINSVFGPPEDMGSAASHTGTSIFDPVLCELAYSWFCPPGGLVLDPFAGGSVRGIVAGTLGRSYAGIDLSETQLTANREQAQRIFTDEAPGSNLPSVRPQWHHGDSRDVATIAPGSYDFLFSCPPYADLEVYSDDPKDLSTMSYPDFLEAYRAIIAACAEQLRDNRFACFVVGDIRDKHGQYRGFVGDTITAFNDVGMTLYNDAVLLTVVGSLPIRAARPFEGSRKLGKTHQNVLVFVKGNASQAAIACGPVEVWLPSEIQEALSVVDGTP